MRIDSTNARQVLYEIYYIKKYYCTNCRYYEIEEGCKRHKNIIKCYKENNKNRR